MVFKKISLSIVSMMMVASVAACSSGNVPSSVGINGGADFANSNLSQVNFNKVVQSLNAQGEKPTVIDMGYKGGVSFAVKINVPNDGSAFSTKANASGHKFVRADVDRVKVFLFAAASFTTADIINPATGSEFTLTRGTSGVINVVFTNVPGNANPWRVAVASCTTNFGGSNATPRNITNAVGSYGTYGTALGEIYAVSSTGGDLNGGSLAVSTTEVTINPLSTAALEIATTLVNADGATIDSNTTVTDGSPTPSGTLTAS